MRCPPLTDDILSFYFTSKYLWFHMAFSEKKKRETNPERKREKTPSKSTRELDQYSEYSKIKISFIEFHAKLLMIFPSENSLVDAICRLYREWQH